MRTISSGIVLALSTSALAGCVVVRSPHAGYVYGGGSIGLFVIIVVLALLFGRHR